MPAGEAHRGWAGARPGGPGAGGEAQPAQQSGAGGGTAVWRERRADVPHLRRPGGFVGREVGLPDRDKIKALVADS
ncbi:MAG: hypothetical protein IMY86_00710 [Chloroflexi bacterium]|nr:hypothetical protein [Chloroflexota bacterium]